jgi:hypothetical protein
MSFSRLVAKKERQTHLPKRKLLLRYLVRFPCPVSNASSMRATALTWKIEGRLESPDLHCTDTAGNCACNSIDGHDVINLKIVLRRCEADSRLQANEEVAATTYAA